MRKLAAIILTAITGWLLFLSPGFAYTLGPRSQYCLKVLTSLKPICQSLPYADQPVVIQFSVDNYGYISQIQFPPQQNTSYGYTKGQTIAWQQIQAMKRLDAPPAGTTCPLRLSASLFNQTEKSAVLLSDIDWTYYTAELDRLIRRNWFPPKSLETRVVIIRFKVMPDGNINSLAIVRSCGEPEIDRSALEAVEKSAPFPNPPDGCSGSPYFQFKLDYKVIHRENIESRNQSY